jgi:hypothetical protein
MNKKRFKMDFKILNSPVSELKTDASHIIKIII